MKKKQTSKILIWSIVAAILIAGGGAFYYFNYYLLSIGVPVERAIPKNASLIFEFKNIHSTIQKLKKSNYSLESEKTELISKILHNVIWLDSVFSKEAKLNQLLQERKILASLHLTKSGEYDYLFVLDLSKTPPPDLENIFSQLNIPSEKREYEQTTIFELKNIPLVFSYKKGLLLASKTAFLVEDALLQLKDKNSILKDASFLKVKELSAKNADCSVYINYQNLPLLASVYAEQTYQSVLEKLKETAQWSSLDIVINEKNILLNGYTSIDAKNSLLASFSQSSPPDNELINILPSNTSVMFYNSMEKFSLPQNDFASWVGNEWAYAIVEPFDTNFSAMEFAVVKTNDLKIAEEKLSALSEQKADTAADVEIYKNFKIRKLVDENSLDLVFGKMFSNIKNPYYTFIDEFAVFANSLNELKNFIEKYYNQQTLSKEDNYLSFSENLNSNSNFFIYLNLSKSLQIFNAFAPEKMITDLKNNFQYYQKFSPIAIQFSSHKDMFYTTGCINYSSSVSKQKGMLWKIQLDTLFEMKPQIVLNHATKDKEIIVQDLRNNLYLISKGGQILWQKNLDEKVISEIYQIDFLKNGKLQYFFNTKNKVWLIDRNGEEVSNFNLHLNSPASAGMTLLDYDKNKNYRFFIPCENGNIYGYEMSGKPLVGWNPKNNIGIVNQPIQYFLVDKKDYLLCVNDAGTIYLFNRKGEQKAKVELTTQFKNPFFLNEFWKDKKTKISYLVSSDTSGKIQLVNFEGKSSVKEFPNHHWSSNYLFALEDVAGDSLNEWCFADGNKLFVFKNDSTLLFDYQFSIAFSGDLFFINENESGKSKLALVNNSSQQLFLFNPDGTLSNGFPIAGTTPFQIVDLFKDNGRILIAGNKDGYLFAYRLE